MSEKQKQTRTQVAPTVITWIKTNPKTTFTLAEITGDLEFQSSSVSAAIYTLVERNTLPGLVVLGRGVYRYDPDAVPEASKPEATEVPEAPKRFTLVGNIDRKAVVLSDSDGNLWRAERLR